MEISENLTTFARGEKDFTVALILDNYYSLIFIGFHKTHYNYLESKSHSFLLTTHTV